MENEEIQNDIEIVSKRNRLEEEFQRKLDNNQFKVMTTFKKIKNLYSDGIGPKIKHHKRDVSNSLKDLMGEENEENKKIYHKKLAELKDVKASKSSVNLSNLSDKAKFLSKKIQFQVNKVKKSHEDIKALNALYLENDSNFQEVNNNKSNNRYNNNLDNSIKLLDYSNYEEAIRKKKIRNNFELVTNKYHKGFNKAFVSRFNPDQYLSNLKMLIQISPTMRDDISKIKKEVDGDIKTITDKNRYTKKYKRIMEKSVKSQSLQRLDPQLYKSDEIIKKSGTAKNLEMGIGDKEQRKNSIFLPNIGNDRSLSNNRDNRIKIGIIKKMQGRDSKIMMNIVENQFDHISRLHNLSKEIDSYIGHENIGKKIDKNLHDFKVHKYMSLFKDSEDRKNFIFKPKDYYLLQKYKINNLFGDLYINKLNAKVLEKEKKLTDKLRINKDDYFNKINKEMKNSLSELDNNMNLNGISIEK